MIHWIIYGAAACVLIYFSSALMAMPDTQSELDMAKRDIKASAKVWKP
jgi:hypothetical protein